MKVSLFYLPGVGSREDVEQGMAGLRPELYQEMLRDLTEEAKLGDELGYYLFPSPNTTSTSRDSNSRTTP